MSINRDPEIPTELPVKLLAQAKELNFQIVYVTLVAERHASFYGLFPFLPPLGSQIRSEDDIDCEVKKIVFDTHNLGDCMVFIPHVYAAYPLRSQDSEPMQHAED